MALLASRAVLSAAVCVVLLVPGDAPAKKTYPACSPARYLIAGGPLLTAEGQGVGDVLIVTASEVAVSGLCDPTAARLTGTKKGITKVSARWRACTGLRGRVRLRGRIVDECSRFTGNVRAKKFHHAVVGMRSRCGDGTVDAGAGETCEPPATGSCGADCRRAVAAIAPTVSLTVDPGAGVAPLTVTFTAAVFDPDGGSITWAWDFGDGASGTGGPTATHSYAAPGTYRATVTVSDGQGTDRGLALVDVGTETTSAEIGPAGGAIQRGRFNLEVSAGAFAATVPLTVLEFPSQASLVDLDPARFRPIGPAFRVDGPFLAGTPLLLTLGYDPAAVPAGFDPANLGVLFRADPGMDEPTGVTPMFTFGVLPATVHPGSATAETTIYGPGKFQVVAMAAPLTVVEASGPLALDLAARAAPAGPPFRVVIMDAPYDSEATFVNEIMAGLQGAFSTYVLSKGFDAPPSQVTVYSRVLPPDQAGKVCGDNALNIFIDPVKPLQRRRVVAHEYFHVIQLWNSNHTSTRGQTGSRNAWFLEGSAEWAEDVVFDAVPDEYLAPTGHRFTLPLNRDYVRQEDLDGDGENDRNHYRTVAFWKWLETRAPGSVQLLMHDHMLKTHTVVELVSGFRQENTAEALHLDSLKAVHGDLDFLAFVASALYWKDFDTDETGTGDLWDPSRLGPIAPKDVPAWFRDPTQDRIKEFRAGSPGDSESNPQDLEYILTPHLSADVQVLVNPADSGLSGILHLEFDPTYSIAQMAIISRTSGRDERIRDLSQSNKVETAFSPGDEVVVLSTDPEWSEPETNFKLLTYRGWVESCGRSATAARPPIDVPCCSIDDVIAALETATPGDLVRLAAGTYVAPGRLWTRPEHDLYNWPASLVVWPGVTLAGPPGEGDPTAEIVLSGSDSGLLALDKTVIRDLRIRPQWWQGIETLFNHELALCHVKLQGQTQLLAGLDFVVTDAKSATVDVFDSTFSCGLCDGYGIDIRGYSAEPPGDVTVRIRDSEISGWDTGLHYGTSEGEPPVALDVDCADFRSNDHNVYDWATSTEQCRE